MLRCGIIQTICVTKKKNTKIDTVSTVWSVVIIYFQIKSDINDIKFMPEENKEDGVGPAV